MCVFGTAVVAALDMENSGCNDGKKEKKLERPICGERALSHEGSYIRETRVNIIPTRLRAEGLVTAASTRGPSAHGY